MITIVVEIEETPTGSRRLLSITGVATASSQERKIGGVYKDAIDVAEKFINELLKNECPDILGTIYERDGKGLSAEQLTAVKNRFKKQ